MTEPQPITGVAGWRSRLAGTFMQEHELRLTDLITDPDDPETFTLRFMSPHQSDSDLACIHQCFAVARPEVYRYHLITTVRGTALTPHSPPPIDITFVPGTRLPSAREADWGAWVSECEVLREFGPLVLARALAAADNRAVDLYLTPVNGKEVDSADLRSQLPRIASRLPGRYAGGTVAIESITVDPADRTVEPSIVLCARAPEPARPTATEPGDPGQLAEPADPWADTTGDEPTDPTPARPVRNSRHAVNGLLLRLYRGWHGENAIPPAGYPDQLTRTAFLFGLATTVALVGGALTCAALSLLFLLLGGLGGAADMVRNLEGAQIVLRPVESWLTAHTAGMNVPPSAILTVWASTGIVTFLLSFMHRSIGARIGWTLWGAATCYIAYAGTSIPSKPIAAGIAAVWWSALSVLAFRRQSRPGPSRVGERVDDVTRAVTRLISYGIPGGVPDWSVPSQRGTTVDEIPIDLPEDGGPEAEQWENLLADAGLPGLSLLHDPDKIGTGDVVRLHVRLPDPAAGATRTVMTKAAIKMRLPQIELLLAKRKRELFPSGQVTPGIVTVSSAHSSDGAELVDEVLIDIFTGRVLDCRDTKALHAAIVEIVTASGDNGIGMVEVMNALQARGYHTITRGNVAGALTVLSRRNLTGPGKVFLTGGYFYASDTD